MSRLAGKGPSWGTPGTVVSVGRALSVCAIIVVANAAQQKSSSVFLSKGGVSSIRGGRRRGGGPPPTSNTASSSSSSTLCDRELIKCLNNAECEACEAFSPPVAASAYEGGGGLTASLSEYCSDRHSPASPGVVDAAACKNDGAAICCHDELSSLQDGVGCLKNEPYLDYVMCTHRVKGCSVDDVRCIDPAAFFADRDAVDVWVLDRKSNAEAFEIGGVESPAAIEAYAAVSCALALLVYVAAATVRRRRCLGKGIIIGGLQHKLDQYSK